MMRYVLVVLSVLPLHAFAAEDTVNTLGKLRSIPKDLSENYSAGYYASKDTFGMRSNAVVAAFKANSNNPFDFPILGFPFVKALGSYGDRDSVGLYVDNTSPPFKTWEIIPSATYTPTSFSSYGLDISRIKPGMIIDTDHQPKWSSYVVAVNDDKVITAGWVNAGTKKMGTPTSGVGLKINPITKVWATNFNVFLPEKGRSDYGVIQENAIVNNKIANPTAVNGLDTVVLSQSRYGGTAAYLSRSADGGFKQQWRYGFMAQGSIVSFISANSSTHVPSVGFLETSKAKNGMMFTGLNTESSITWKNGGRIVASIDPKGLISKFGYKTTVIKSDTRLSDTIGRYLINAQNKVILTLPKKEDVFSGYGLKLMKISPLETSVIFISADSSVNGKASVEMTGGTWNKEAVYDGENWHIY